MVIVKKETAASNRHIHFHGLTEARVIDSEEGLFAALLEIAYHHTAHDIEIYENQLRNSIVPDQKTFFLQLIFRKKDILNRLQRYRAEFSLGHAAVREIDKSALPKNYVKKPLISMKALTESFQFTFQRENRTFALYNKLKETMRHDSTKALFDYLVAAQYNCLVYLTTEFAEHGLSLNGTESLRKDEAV